MATTKTQNFIAWKIQTTMPNLYNRIPKTNKHHPDERANWRGIILLDALKNITQQNAQVIISFIEAGDEKSVEQFIFGIQGLSNN